MSESSTQQKVASPRVIWSLLICSLIIAALVQVVSIALPRLLPPSLPPSPTHPGYTFFVFSLPVFISFLINPVVFFAVTYVIGRNIELSKRYVPTGISLFVGGLVGGSVPYFLLPEALGAQWQAAFPDLLSVVTTVADFAIILLGFGLSTLFCGFFAVTLDRNFASGVLIGAGAVLVVIFKKVA